MSDPEILDPFQKLCPFTFAPAPRAAAPALSAHRPLLRQRTLLLPVASQLKHLPTTPVGASAWHHLPVARTSAGEATALATGGCQSTKLPVLHDGGADPLVSGVVADCCVHGVDEDHFVVFVHGVLAHPVAVEHPQVATDAATHARLGHLAEVHAALLLAHTLVAGLSVDNAFGHALLAVAAANTHAVNNETLLLLIPQTPGLNKTLTDTAVTAVPSLRYSSPRPSE